MYPTYENGHPKDFGLTEDDIEGIQKLYGKNSWLSRRLCQTWKKDVKKWGLESHSVGLKSENLCSRPGQWEASLCEALNTSDKYQ